jgi:hypothetical protein
MSKKNKTPPKLQIPRDALGRINLGQSFAEYDRLLDRPDVFVVTPAIQAAMDPSRSKCFFVGRRGTGKTAITFYLQKKKQHVVQLHPQLFTTLAALLTSVDLSDTRQRPVQSLVASFRRSIVDEVVSYLVEKKLVSWNELSESMSSERNYIDDHDFDTRTLAFVEEALQCFKTQNEKAWLRFMRTSKEVGKSLEAVRPDGPDVLVLIDRIDDTWDGSDSAVVLLMALMHACVEVAGASRCVRPMLFLRENIFERVRQIDNEFVRLETCVVSLDWTKPLLDELIERRLQQPLYPKPPIGETWDHLFELASGKSSKELVFEYCQHRPRDVLTYCSYAIESAQAQNHAKVQIEDLQQARRRFSESRLKDLGDEYSENFPQIAIVLARFHGLAKSLTVYAVEGFVKRLLVDDEVKACCGSWIFRFTAPHQFIELLFGIGFWGVGDGNDVEYRGVGVKASTAPPITAATQVVIHPSYVEALDLQDKVLSSFDDVGPLQKEGLLLDLPDAISFKDYQAELTALLNGLDKIPVGKAGASEYEKFIGSVVHLCFFRVLTNAQQHSRDIDGRVIRDRVVSNVAVQGFWEMVRQRHGATQIIWECKNYTDLTAADFHQTVYYMNPQIGKFAVVCFRGEDRSKRIYLDHIRRISQKHQGMVVLLGDKDLKVFIRQAINGKVKESHIREIYDSVVRSIS